MVQYVIGNLDINEAKSSEQRLLSSCVLRTYQERKRTTEKTEVGG